MHDPQYVYSQQSIAICILRQTASRSYGVAQVLGNNSWPQKYSFSLLAEPFFSCPLFFSVFHFIIYITEYDKSRFVGRASKSIDFALCCILDSHYFGRFLFLYGRCSHVETDIIHVCHVYIVFITNSGLVTVTDSTDASVPSFTFFSSFSLLIR